MVVDLEARVADGVVHGRVQTFLEIVAGDEVLDPPAAHADQVVVVLGQVLGELEVAVLVTGGDPVHDPGIDQFCEVAVRAALGQAPVPFEDVGDRQRPVGGGEDGYDLSTRPRVAELLRAEPLRHDRVQVVGDAAVVVGLSTGHERIVTGGPGNGNERERTHRCVRPIRRYRHEVGPSSADQSQPVGAEPPDRAPTSLPGHIRLLRVVGRGAGATVWRARDRRRGEDVAVKVVDLDGEAGGLRRSRVEAEMRSLIRLSAEPCVLPVRAMGSDEGAAWIVTPLADSSLIELVRRDGPFAPTESVRLAASIAAALEAAHALDVVHGDVTPANVLDLAGTMVLADFGSSSLDGPPAGPGAATPGWAAPEVLDGAMCAPASDVYGLGATVWTAATGDRSRPGCPPDVSMLPRGLSGLVDVCCDPDPDRRPSATEVRSRAAAELSRRSRYCPDP